MSKARDFTVQHAAVCARARIENPDWTHREIAERAGEFGLYGVTFPRAPSVSQVQRWCGKTNRVAAGAEPPITAEQMKQRILAVLWAEIDATLPKLKGEKLLSYGRQALGSIAAAERQARAPKHDASRKPKAENGGAADRAPTIDRFIDEMREGQDTSQSEDEALLEPTRDGLEDQLNAA